MSWLKTFLLTAVVALLGARLVATYLLPAWNTIVTDFPNYYVAAWAARHGEPLNNLYDPVWFDQEKHRAGIDRPAALFNYFPPMNALVMWPFANWTPLGAKRAWTVVNVAALIAVIALTVNASGLRWPVAVLIALLGGDALGNNFTFGQFYIVLTLIMVSAVVLSKRFPHVAGFATGAGAVTKIFPGFLLIYFAIRRDYRSLMWSLIAIVALTGVGLLLLGWAPHRVYLEEVFARSLRGEIQDPYNIHWNTLQALIRRALVRDDMLNPQPIIDIPWLFFFLRPLLSLAIAVTTFYCIARAARPDPLLTYGVLIAMVSLITPSQASYHQFLFYPAVAAFVAQDKPWMRKVFVAALFALLCSNVMGATARFDSGMAMILAFPRVALVMILWAAFAVSLAPPMPRATIMAFAPAAATIVLLGVLAFFEQRRWIADVSDGATRVELPATGVLEVQPRFVDGRLVVSILTGKGFIDLPPAFPQVALSPDAKWTAFSTNARGNWDIAIQSHETGQVRYLTSSSANDITPSFSPDGKFVYFASDRHHGYRFTTIYRVSVNAQ